MNKEELQEMYDNAKSTVNYYTREWIESGKDSAEKSMQLWETRVELLEKLIATF